MEIVHCDCGRKPRRVTIRKIGVPSGDVGYETTIYCLGCGRMVVRWALKKSWVIESATHAWNYQFKDD